LQARRLRGMPQSSRQAGLLGGLRMAIPIGAIYTSNITADPNSGIGHMSLDDFDRALRFGVAEGHSLYPRCRLPRTTTRVRTMLLRCTLLQVRDRRGGGSESAERHRVSLVDALAADVWRCSSRRRQTVRGVSRNGLPAGQVPILSKGWTLRRMSHSACGHDAGESDDAAGGVAYLSGAVIENYFAPSLRNSAPELSCLE